MSLLAVPSRRNLRLSRFFKVSFIIIINGFLIYFLIRLVFSGLNSRSILRMPLARVLILGHSSIRRLRAFVAT